MKEEKLGQEPAFPVKLNQVIGQTTYNFTDENGNGQIAYHNNYADIVYQGVSKRFYAACAAMQGLIASNPKCLQGNIDMPVPHEVVKLAFEYADELLRQEGL